MNKLMSSALKVSGHALNKKGTCIWTVLCGIIFNVYKLYLAYYAVHIDKQVVKKASCA